MNPYLIFVLIVIIGHYLLDLLVDVLDLKRLSPNLPEEFAGYYDAERYAKSQQYLRDNMKFGFWSNSVNLALMLPFILLGGFNYVDKLARSFGWGEILSGLVFGAILMIAGKLIALPFDIYRTFVIEERYGFNLTKPKTFVADFFKGLLLNLIINLLLLAVAIWFFNAFGKFGWLYVWGALALFMLFMLYFAPVIIMPIFNKFVPLDEGELKTAIEGYAQRQSFKLKGIFKMDGSRRSSKANAFFTGFGKLRRIVLYDTLIKEHTVPELVVVLAHEVGHNKLGHVPKRMGLMILNFGLMLFILSFFIRSPGLAAAFKMEHVSIYAGLVFFMFLYSPISVILSIGLNALERRDEYQADAFAVRTTGSALEMIEGLKKMSVQHLTNLTPHPLRVALEYDHPPILERVKALRELKPQDNPA
jgi:STE24 endopeptidase